MLRIPCPFCGERAESEFTFGGPSHILRPEPAEVISDKEWAEYLFFRDNPRGVHFERWQHVFGCRQWFNLGRDTVTHEILASYAMREAKPCVVGEQ